MNPGTSDSFPTFRKAAAAMRRIPGFCLRCVKALLRRLRLLFLSRKSLKCYLVLATLIILAYTTLRWVGRRAWEDEKQRVAALGMATDFRAFDTPTPRDEDNFLAADVFQDLFADPPRNLEKYSLWLGKTRWAVSRPKGVNSASSVPRPRQGALADWGEYFRLTGMFPTPSAFPSTAKELLADQRWVPTIQAIYAAALRPASKFPTSENSAIGSSTGPKFDNKKLSELHRSVLLYAQAQLEEGEPAQAFPALSVTNHLIQAYAKQPDFTSALRPIGLLTAGEPLLQSGMRLHRWPAPVLKGLLAADYPELIGEFSQRGFQSERLRCTGFFQNFPESLYGPDWVRNHPYRNFMFRHIIPDYILQRAATRTSQYYSRLYQAASPLRTDEGWPSRIQTLAETPDPRLGPDFLFGRWASDFDAVMLFTYSHVGVSVRASIRHLAIAIELHYLIHAKYPASLEQLVPSIGISPQIIRDFNGKPLGYQVDDTGSFFTIFSRGVDGIENSPQPHADYFFFSTDPGHKAGK